MTPRSPMPFRIRPGSFLRDRLGRAVLLSMAKGPACFGSRGAGMMDHGTSRRHFLGAGPATAAGFMTAGATPVAADAGAPVPEYPRDRPGTGGPVGSPTDRGKLVPGLRPRGMPPVPVHAPDLAKLPWIMRDGAKEFHLVAQPVKREFLPNL